MFIPKNWVRDAQNAQIEGYLNFGSERRTLYEIFI